MRSRSLSQAWCSLPNASPTSRLISSRWDTATSSLAFSSAFLSLATMSLASAVATSWLGNHSCSSTSL
eukprot:CAMPEP_0171280034 /NCGR_PEP_ID=MMETSP0790-20130122/65688_1 /TAXON_ID=2925 /ORGANISM="Alexandrium catenella, Strain OF101" /LENGTH=67 /DNA_ID=CAMNT_0011749233 /DNA_START=15 /DNA_END=214 /DNA_ORIENTATION=-